MDLNMLKCVEQNESTACPAEKHNQITQNIQ